MCGICCIFRNGEQQLTIEDLRCNSRIHNRGPDRSCVANVHLSNQTSVLFSGHVLHLRGENIISQPDRDKKGNLLLWNGEIFNGIQVNEDENDTEILLNILGNDDNDDHILNTLSKIQGPWSLIYWQASSETLWFGRDVFGRRSLLWHLPQSEQDDLILTSVQIKPWTFVEVPSVGIFKLTRSTSEHICPQYHITVYPWQQAVWPGTLTPVKNDLEFSSKIYQGERHDRVTLSLLSEREVPSQMPEINKDVPTDEDTKIPDLEDQQDHIDYLQTLLDSNCFLRTLSQQLTSVLLEAVKTRVFNQPNWASKNTDEVKSSPQANAESDDPGYVCDVTSCPSSLGTCEGGATCQSTSAPHGSHMASDAKVAILFSGGIDSTMIAALADRCLPKDEPIDLLNVAFEMKIKDTGKKKRRPCENVTSNNWDVPDRLTGYTALSELNPDRHWNFIEVNVSAAELQEARQAHIQGLVYPLETVLDDSIGCAVWFAARGRGVLGNGPHKGMPVQSVARVILCGMGADEQLVGYSRHRVRFKMEGWVGLIKEIALEVTRISSRNLGRDDRIITDHGKESRFPFLDERVVQFLSSLPVHNKANLELPRGLGEKLLLRLSAFALGLHQTATLPKRAIQFGSRIAKLENSKEKASDKCTRLVKTDVSEG